MEDWVKRSTLRWFGEFERMENEELVKKVYLSSVEGPNRRGRPLRRWEDRGNEVMESEGKVERLRQVENIKSVEVRIRRTK